MLLHSPPTQKQNIERNLQFSAIAWHFKATKRSLCIERIVTVDPTIKTSILKRQFNTKEKQDDDNSNNTIKGWNLSVFSFIQFSYLRNQILAIKSSFAAETENIWVVLSLTYTSLHIL